VPDLPRPHAGRRVHHSGLDDRPAPRASPDPRRARGVRRTAEPPIDAGPPEPRHVTTRRTPVRRRPDFPLRTRPPTPRDHAGPFGVRGSPPAATRWRGRRSRGMLDG
jgi:hypothetical protein